MRLANFSITNYRNIIDSGWIKTTDVTAIVGQNEAGKSNLFEALYCLHSYVETRYDADEDWPVDNWKGKKNADGKRVARAYSTLKTARLQRCLSMQPNNRPRMTKMPMRWR